MIDGMDLVLVVMYSSILNRSKIGSCGVSITIPPTRIAFSLTIPAIAEA